MYTYLDESCGVGGFAVCVCMCVCVCVYTYLEESCGVGSFAKVDVGEEVEEFLLVCGGDEGCQEEGEEHVLEGWVWVWVCVWVFISGDE